MTQILRTLFMIATAMALLSCSNDTNHYRTTTPEFKLEQFFNGKIIGYGLVTNFSDDMVRRFTVDIDASWEGDVGTLDEDFVYDDGEKQFRRWVVQRTGEQTYQGRADDIIGEAVGEGQGSYLRWQYRMILPVDDTQYEVTFDDQMFLIDDNHMMNIAHIKKFGITVAKVTIFFDKVTD
ncbi:DUF3833 domain-containing protein [Thalassotalea ponticola]|uniref:DUF3833 domain-containing protein n=1 Tax=Thalassotalea ponticola TaxID=1523392 RepID=UPI0025B4181D|nr:DUF3833 domain-containing protein [Thalassotalea ponticola]MDN3652000.1 DUF3833 domain-containing protein [Thalassotalea ponticola]